MQYCRKNGLGTSLLSINSLAKQLDLEINLPRLVGQSIPIKKIMLVVLYNKHKFISRQYYKQGGPLDFGNLASYYRHLCMGIWSTALLL